MGFYSHDELIAIGFQSIGNDVLISTKASIYSPEQISLGNHVRVDDFCILSGRITLGSYIHVAAYTALYGGKEGIEVGDFSNISSRICIYALSDDYSGETMTNPMVPEQYKNVTHKKVIIGKHCIIGTACTVLPGVIIPDGCAFGAYSFVNQSCEPWSIYAGIPCRRIKERSKELLQFAKALT